MDEQKQLKVSPLLCFFCFIKSNELLWRICGLLSTEYLSFVFIQFNGVNMLNKTKEDAYLEMLKPVDTTTFKVQNCADSLADIRETHGDGFFVR